MLFNDIAQIKEQVEQTSNYPSNIVKFCYMFTWDHHFIAHVVFWAKKTTVNNMEVQQLYVSVLRIHDTIKI